MVVLLIERPRLRIYQQIVEIRLGNTSLLTVDPQVRDAQYIRSYARRIIRKSNVCLPFPKEMFKVHEILGAKGTLKYTLGDIDRFSRDAEIYSQRLGKCNGILNAVITEMNMNSL